MFQKQTTEYKKIKSVLHGRIKSRKQVTAKTQPIDHRWAGWLTAKKQPFHNLGRPSCGIKMAERRSFSKSIESGQNELIRRTFKRN